MFDGRLSRAYPLDEGQGQVEVHAGEKWMGAAACTLRAYSSYAIAMRQWQQQHWCHTEVVTCSIRCYHKVADVAVLFREVVEWQRSCYLSSAMG